MKNLLMLLIVALTFASCSSADSKYMLIGKIDDAKPGWVILSKVVDNKFVPIDSLNSKKGDFTFSGFIEMPEIYYLSFKEDDISHRIFIEPGKIVVAGTLMEPQVGGSASHNVYQNYVQGMKSWDDQRQILYDEFKTAMNNGDEDRLDIIRQLADDIDNGQNLFITDFIFSQRENVVGAYVLINNVYQFELEDLMKKRSSFSTSLASSKYIQMIDSHIMKLQSVAIGQVAPIFTQNDPQGNPVNLTDLRGNYLLIDFWASWCGPCRRENPNIVAAWEKYSAKGFDILGVSLDRNHAEWLKAIEDDKLTWTHVSDLKFWSNEASNLYGVNSIPASFLLDPDGVIIAKNLRDEELHQKLKEIFGN